MHLTLSKNDSSCYLHRLVCVRSISYLILPEVLTSSVFVVLTTSRIPTAPATRPFPHNSHIMVPEDHRSGIADTVRYAVEVARFKVDTVHAGPISLR